MRKIRMIVAVWFLCLSCVLPVQAGQKAQVPEVSAKAAVLLVADTREVLFAKNGAQQRPMASTTKIMTALLALEAGTPQRVLRITQEMVQVEGSALGLKAGDQITMQDLLTGMLLCSGNDAANAVALSLEKSIPAFAQKMNQRARQMGMQHTNFETPSGLDAERHYSTAYDMALLGSTAIQNPAFVEICSQENATIRFGDPPVQHTVRNSNRILREYDGAIGIKTGFTKKSGRCLVTAATREGITLVAVTLSAANDWADHRKLLDYGFSILQKQELKTDVSELQIPVVGGLASAAGVQEAMQQTYATKGQVSLQTEIRIQPFLYAPVTAGAVVGEVCYRNAAGRIFYRTPLVAKTDVPLQVYVQEEAKQSWIFELWGRIRARES